MDINWLLILQIIFLVLYYALGIVMPIWLLWLPLAVFVAIVIFVIVIMILAIFIAAIVALR